MRASPLTLSRMRLYGGRLAHGRLPTGPSSNRANRRMRMFSPVLAIASFTSCSIVREPSLMNGCFSSTVSSTEPSASVGQVFLA